MAGAIMCRHVAVYIQATWRRMCAHVFAHVHVCARVRVNSGLGILFRIYVKPIKCALFIYPTVGLKFCHVGLFLFISICR